MPIKNKGKKPRNRAGKPWWPHGSGYWSARVNGKTVYLCRWNGPDGQPVGNDELDRLYRAAKDAAEAAPVQPAAAESGDWSAVAFEDLLAKYVQYYEQRHKNNEIARDTVLAVRFIADLLAQGPHAQMPVGELEPHHFSQISQWLFGRVHLRTRDRAIITVKAMFKWGGPGGDKHLQSLPAYGTDFKQANARQWDAEKKGQPPKLFTLEQIHKLLGAAEPEMKAWILLGLNCGFTSIDLSELTLEKSALDLDAGRLSFPRTKTHVARTAALWPETIAAIRAAIGDRTTGRAFPTRWGTTLINYTPKGDKVDSVQQRFARLKQKVGITGHRLAFGTLRHNHRTWSSGAGDLEAAAKVMGHKLPGMSKYYVEEIEMDRLRAVAEHVRRKIFGPAPSAEPGQQTVPAASAGSRLRIARAG